MPYCTNCGGPIESSDTFCKNCGTQIIDGGDNFQSGQNDWRNNYGPSDQNRNTDGPGSPLTFIMVLGFIWGAFSILAGLLFYAGTTVLYLAGPVAGTIFLVGGILAIISCVCISKLENFQTAFICCLLGSLIALYTGGVAIGIVGLLFTLLLNNEKHRFRS